MKKLFLGLALTVICANVTATTLYDQLCAFNFNWKKYYMQAPDDGARNFSSDRELIQAHLANVIRILRSASTDNLSNAQRTSRAHMIELLDGYRTAGNFPMNYYRPERIPVFIDEHGTHCAVGYLMMMTGQDEMAQRISYADNYVWVKDLKDAGVPAWQQASGLSFAELALIQGAYDWYPQNSYYLANRFETPQQPKCTTAYFGGHAKTRNVWCKGEGSNDVLNGKWIQNYSEGLPWIEGYFTNGKRSGQWKEYYKGTTQLCRTEYWADNELNGTRTRFDRDGNVTEEILFSEGVAASKIDYDLHDSLAYVRVPEGKDTVLTMVYNSKGQLIAAGHEIVYNPGNLQWFQSIELTALNVAQVTARNEQTGNGNLNATGGLYGTNPFSDPPLVTYLKTGDWVYFQDSTETADMLYLNPRLNVLGKSLIGSYHHFGYELYSAITMFSIEPTSPYDSIHVEFWNDHVVEFYGYHPAAFAHLHLEYTVDSAFTISSLLGPIGEKHAFYYVKECGQYNRFEQRVGTWNYYNEQGALCKTEEYLIPRDEDEL